jgi:diaminohydroxyphosphoribosylaminopyrimidine deaminase/5-amino-6-(5-phosphoribosylamino)uracil reductase
VRSVVYALADPNPLVSGKGAAALAAAGIQVRSGVLAEEAREIMQEFFHFMRTGQPGDEKTQLVGATDSVARRCRRPFITIKYAMTLDGRLALDNGDARWISGEESRAHVQLLRKRAQAILTGGETIRRDDPRLDCRIAGESFQPLRIVVTERGIPANAQLFAQGGRVLIVTNQKAERSLDPALAQKAEILALPRLEINEIIAALAERNIVSILVEAGTRFVTELIAARLCDQVYAFVAPLLAGGKRREPLVDIATARTRSAQSPLPPGRTKARGQSEADALRLEGSWIHFGADICFHGRPL